MKGSSIVLLDYARDLLNRLKETAGGLWPRACALICRQALEASLDELWMAEEPEIAGCPRRAQFLCLGPIIDNYPLAQQAYHAWWTLSRACHQHPYELPPTEVELSLWLNNVESIILEIGRSAERDD